MNVLAIDTSGPVMSCCLMRNERVEHLIRSEHGLTHSETVMPAVDAVLSSSGLKCSDVDLFACVAGPGSFTGVRLGVCTVKGLAAAVGKPCMPVHALEALSFNLSGFPGLVCPILDARRGQVYCAAFDVSSGDPARVLEDGAEPLEVFAARLPGGVSLAFVGDGVRVHKERLRGMFGGRCFPVPEHLTSLSADAVCVLASRRTEQWTDAAHLSAVYLRAPQAERERAERMNHE